MVSLCACGDGSKAALSKRSSKTFDAAGKAALTPLADLNIYSDKVPEQLVEIVKAPYRIPKPLKCDTLKEEVAVLDTLLGPDVDAPKATLTAREEYAEVGGEMISDGIVGFVRKQTDIIPLRSIVRKITGAQKKEKAFAAATQAGKLRRAYLKGIAEAQFGTKCSFAPIIVTEATPAEKKDEKKAADLEPLEVAKK